MSQTTSLFLLSATFDTLYMVVLSSMIATLVGLPLGVTLYATRKGHILEHPGISRLLSAIVNIGRSVPFIILLIAITPFTRFIVGTSIGKNAAIVPLSIAAMPFIARIVENALLEVSKGLIEAAIAMGATAWQIITKVLIPEALPGIINGLTLTIISLIGFSAMAGYVGAGGLGDIAYRYGVQRFDGFIMLMTIVIMVILVQAVQFIGDKLSLWIAHTRE